AGRFAFELALQTGDQVTVAVQVRERRAVGAVELGAGIVGQRVVDRNHCVLGDLHGAEYRRFTARLPAAWPAACTSVPSSPPATRRGGSCSAATGSARRARLIRPGWWGTERACSLFAR